MGSLWIWLRSELAWLEFPDFFTANSTAIAHTLQMEDHDVRCPERGGALTRLDGHRRSRASRERGSIEGIQCDVVDEGKAEAEAKAKVLGRKDPASVLDSSGSRQGSGTSDGVSFVWDDEELSLKDIERALGRMN